MGQSGVLFSLLVKHETNKGNNFVRCSILAAIPRIPVRKRRKQIILSSREGTIRLYLLQKDDVISNSGAVIFLLRFTSRLTDHFRRPTLPYAEYKT